MRRSLFEVSGSNDEYIRQSLVRRRISTLCSSRLLSRTDVSPNCRTLNLTYEQPLDRHDELL